MTILTAEALRRLALHDWHGAQGARWTSFGGYKMPTSYSAGILREHLHTRSAASLFDISHMGQILLRPKGSFALLDLAHALESLTPIDVASLTPGRQRYGFFTNVEGGIRDDFMIAHLGRYYLIIVNAANQRDDEVSLRESLSGICSIQRATDRVLFALQGPRAVVALRALAPAAARMRFLDATEHVILDRACWVMRSGYTGEDGFEISAPGDVALRLAKALLSQPNVALAGLAARDSLRLEAGLCLQGSDINAHTTPGEAGLDWAIPACRRPSGARVGGFPGAGVILPQLKHGTSRRRVGLRAHTKQPVRGGVELFENLTSTKSIGFVTSGGFGPTLDAPVAMGYVPSECAIAGGTVYAQVRGQRLAMTVVKLPFVPHRYRR